MSRPILQASRGLAFAAAFALGAWIAPALADPKVLATVDGSPITDSDVADAMANGMAGMLENIMGGGPAPDDPFKAGMDDVETLFKTFLLTGDAERVGIPGTPTKASLKRKSSRFKTGINPDGYRPSFIDTGLMEASFKSWVDNAISWRAAAAAYQGGY